MANYLYNGSEFPELPKLPELPQHSEAGKWCLYIVENKNDGAEWKYKLFALTSVMVVTDVSDGVGIAQSGIYKGLSYQPVANNSQWSEPVQDRFVNASTGFNTGLSLIWCDTDVYYYKTDTLYLAASDPVPVGGVVYNLLDMGGYIYRQNTEGGATSTDFAVGDFPLSFTERWVTSKPQSTTGSSTTPTFTADESTLFDVAKVGDEIVIEYTFPSVSSTLTPGSMTHGLSLLGTSLNDMNLSTKRLSIVYDININELNVETRKTDGMLSWMNWESLLSDISYDPVVESTSEKIIGVTIRGTLLDGLRMISSSFNVNNFGTGQGSVSSFTNTVTFASYDDLTITLNSENSFAPDLDPKLFMIGFHIGQIVRRKLLERQLKAGLYDVNTDELVYSWGQLLGDEILSGGVIQVADGVVNTRISGSGSTRSNASSEYLAGYLVLPKNGSIAALGSYAFSYCKNLTSVVIPDSVTSIGTCAFYYSEGLTSIVIPDSVTTIGDYAFEYCKSLVSVVLPNGITNIADSLFLGCESLVEISIPNSVTFIDEWAFRDCTSLTSIELPDGVTSIGDRVFCECTNLSSVSFSPNVTTIEEYAFYNCKNLPDVDLSSITTIGKYAFQNCNSLTELDLRNVTSIGEKAFSNCLSVTDIYFSDNMPSMDEYAFQDSYVTRMSKVHITNLSNWCKYNFPSASNPARYLYVNEELVEHLIIPSDVANLGKHAFYYNLGLTSVDLGNITSIGEYAFEYCKNLTAVTIPDGVTSIGKLALGYCEKLTSLVIPVSVTSIGWEAIYHTDSLTEITYKGTIAQWNKISLDSSWDYYKAEYTIHCTDGDIVVPSQQT